MPHNRQPREPAGIPSPGLSFSVGELTLRDLQKLLDGPSACSFWEPESDISRQGALYRDPRFGLTIVMADAWDEGQTFGPIELRIPLLHGRTARGQLFSLLNVRIESSLHQSEIDATVGFIGAWATGTEPTLDNMTVWIDELPKLFGDQTYDPIGNVSLRPSPASKTAGAMTVTPRRDIRTTPHSQRAEGYRLELQYSQPRKLKWWMEQWINPLTRLTSLCTGEPATTTVLATRTGRRVHGDHEHHNLVYITGQGWPTLDLSALDPPEPSRPVPPLLSWQVSCFKLEPLMRRLRSASNRLDVPFNNYLETVYAHLRPHHEFLNLVQAAESLHSTTAGRFKTSAPNDVTGLLNRAKERGVNSKDRQKIKRALEQLSPNEYSLAERLESLAGAPGLPPSPQDPPPWLHDDDAQRKMTWPIWVSRARNDISHGNVTTDSRWLQIQNRYLKAIIERAVLRELGLPLRHCNTAAGRRYHHG